MSTLHINLQRKWFAAIAAGTKTIEYRDASPFWIRRLAGKNYETITFSNGYATEAQRMTVEFLGAKLRGGRWEILLGRVLSIHHWPPPGRKQGCAP
jgi:hypothetical protein